MRIILKLSDYLDISKADEDVDDEDFEDCEDMEEPDETDVQSTQVIIDLDQAKSKCLQAVFSLLDHILMRS